MEIIRAATATPEARDPTSDRTSACLAMIGSSDPLAATGSTLLVAIFEPPFNLVLKSNQGA
jgi:hypothetical protein